MNETATVLVEDGNIYKCCVNVIFVMWFFFQLQKTLFGLKHFYKTSYETSSNVWFAPELFSMLWIEFL